MHLSRSNGVGDRLSSVSELYEYSATFSSKCEGTIGIKQRIVDVLCVWELCVGLCACCLLSLGEVGVYEGGYRQNGEGDMGEKGTKAVQSDLYFQR